MNSRHLEESLLLRYLDDESAGSEALIVENHLALCDLCRQELAALRKTSGLLDDLLLRSGGGIDENGREQLLTGMIEQERLLLPLQRRKYAWPAACGAAAAMAACLLLGAFLMRFSSREPAVSPTLSMARIDSNVIEVDGEQFLALPYSNPDLPLATPRVIEMDVPLASLTDAGIVIESVSSQIATPNRAVRADVLLGLDGQPLGVHVLDVD